MEASLCLEAAERPQWPRVYSLDRARSRSRMPSLVGDTRSAVDFLKCALILLQSKLSILRAVDKHEPSLTLRVALNKSYPRLI